jgi:hypothetical protein
LSKTGDDGLMAALSQFNQRMPFVGLVAAGQVSVQVEMVMAEKNGQVHGYLHVRG